MYCDAPELANLDSQVPAVVHVASCSHSCWWLCKPRDNRIRMALSVTIRFCIIQGASASIVQAGMLRSDRTLTEKMFLAGVVPVLCCTARKPCGRPAMHAVRLCHTFRPVSLSNVSTFHDCYIIIIWYRLLHPSRHDFFVTWDHPVSTVSGGPHIGALYFDSWSRTKLLQVNISWYRICCVKRAMVRGTWLWVSINHPFSKDNNQHY